LRGRGSRRRSYGDQMSEDRYQMSVPSHLSSVICHLSSE
jgi:hypothetical protein